MTQRKEVIVVSVVLLIIVLHVAFFFGVYFSRHSSDRVVVQQDLECGHWCLIRGSHLLGLPLSRGDAAVALPYYRAKGQSLLDLKQAFEDLGFHVVAQNQTLDEALQETGDGKPVILHLTDPDHFVVLSRHAGQNVIIFDATGRRRRLPLEVVRRRFDGYTLIVQRGDENLALPRFAKRDTTDSPCIQFETLYVDQGDIPVRQASVSYEFPFKNLGAKSLKITRLAGDCSCLDVEGPEEVPPFSSGVIRATFSHRPGETRSAFEHAINIETNDPVLANVSVIAAGNTNTNLIAIPFSLDFGKVSIGQSQVRRCFVQYNGQAEAVLENARFDCTLPNAEVRILTRDEYLAEHPLGQNLVEQRQLPGQVRVVEIIWSPLEDSAGSRVSGHLHVMPPKGEADPFDVALSGTVGSAGNQPE
ncbi:MAG: DUF1573 domain-containing protein [Planctomycetaceae bacterium]|nr:DUF1573 domain-containing protein [Planctomycetaceae bacterium]